MSNENEEREETQAEQVQRIIFGDPDAPNEFSTERLVIRQRQVRDISPARLPGDAQG